MNKINVAKLDNVTKILLILLIGVIFYFAIFSILKPFFITEPTSMMRMMGSDLMNFSSGSSATMNLVALIIAIAIALVVSFYLFRQDDKEQEYKSID